LTSHNYEINYQVRPHDLMNGKRRTAGILQGNHVQRLSFFQTDTASDTSDLANGIYSARAYGRPIK